MAKARNSSKTLSAALICFIVVALTQVQITRSLSCAPCTEETSCPVLKCVGGTHMGPCRCCQVCAKQHHEGCGGPFKILGRCDTNLTCVIQPEHEDLLSENAVGICKPSHSVTSLDDCRKSHFGCHLVKGRCRCGHRVACTNPFRFQSRTLCRTHQAMTSSTRRDCRLVQCNVQKSEVCPQDSVLVEGYVPPGGCCPHPGHCECRAERCAQRLCPPNAQRVLVKLGTHTPGSCCDQYRCVPQGDTDDCAAVKCASPSPHCPSNSIAVPNPFPTNKCCPDEPICQCLKHQCFRPTCSDNKELKVTYRGNGKPGSCCDEYVCTNDIVLAGCSVNGTQHKHGSTYRKDMCTLCECKIGVSYCGPLDCPDLSRCTRVTMNRGDCCPMCLDGDDQDYRSPVLPRQLCRSDDNLQAYAVGETWSPDTCTYCTCEEGGIKRCTAAFCGEPVTATFIPPCNSLSECLLTDSECPDGFEHDDQGCRMCQCKAEIHSCPPISGCKLRCPRGYALDQEGCKVCKCKVKKCKALTTCRKECPFGYKTNRKGCDRCRCRVCPPMESCGKDCSFGLAKNKYGCTVCKCRATPASQSRAVPQMTYPISQSCTDTSTGRRHDDGETWSSDCNICVCRGGDVMCDVMKCPVPECDVPVFKEDACCASCPGDDVEFPLIPPSLSCQEPDADWYVEGDTWEFNQCTNCTCHSGHVMCTSNVCRPAPCENPVYDETLCCPKCLDVLNPLAETPQRRACEDHTGAVYNNGGVFRIDQCTTAVCHNGEIKRFTEKCHRDLPCHDPVLKRGRCCPECLDQSPSFRACNADGEVRSHAEQWNKTSSPCTKCACIDGSVRCRFPECLPIPSKCQRTRLDSTGCCRECILEETGPPFVTIPHPKKSTDNWITLTLIITLPVVFVGLIVTAICVVKMRCSPIMHTKKKYVPGSPSSSPDQKQVMVTCSGFKSGCGDASRTKTASTLSAEEEKKFLGMQ